MKKKMIFMLCIGVVVLVLVVIAAIHVYQTYANQTVQYYSYNIVLIGDTSINVDAYSFKKVIYQVHNVNEGTLNYGIGYSSENSNVVVKAYTTSVDASSGTIGANVYKNITLAVINNSSTNALINLSTLLGYGNGGELILPTGVTQVTETVQNASEYITNLYTNASKTEVINNSITYNYAPSVSLMNDRLGGVSSIDGGNIRYYGEDPNNYIWFGETYTSGFTQEGTVSALGYGNVENCIISEGYSQDEGRIQCTENIVRQSGDKKLYRIIGVFDNMIKVISDDSIGFYSWDRSDSSVNNGNGINEWTEADLMKLLNPGFNNESINNSLYWSKGSGNCYSNLSNASSCNFTNFGLSDNVKNRIATATWNLGGFDDSQGYPNTYYGYENGTNHVSNPSDNVTRNDSWNGKVGLMYASDYGYATDLSLCSGKTLNQYNTPSCILNDWLRHLNQNWTLSSGMSDSSFVWFVDYDGDISTSNANSGTASVRPVFYLDANVIFSSGDGSREHPYVIE